MAYLAAHPQRHVAATVGLDQANVSRRMTQVYDGEREAGDAWTAGQLWAMLCTDEELLGRLIADAMAARHGPGDAKCAATAVMDHLQIALNAASHATASVHPSGPGGTDVTPDEAADLLPVWHRLAAATATAIHRVEQVR